MTPVKTGGRGGRSGGRGSSQGSRPAGAGKLHSPIRAKIIKPLIQSAEHKERDEDATRLVPLGGLEEIGRNMSYVEHKDEIVVIDMGIQFPEEETPGIDFIIPNVDYLAPKKANIRGLGLTDAHLDHVCAHPYPI